MRKELRQFLSILLLPSFLDPALASAISLPQRLGASDRPFTQDVFRSAALETRLVEGFRLHLNKFFAHLTHWVPQLSTKNRMPVPEEEEGALTGLPFAKSPEPDESHGPIVADLNRL